MSTETLQLNRKLLDYLRQVGGVESSYQRELREETSKLEKSNMQISVEQGYLMGFIARAMGVRRYLEIGVFTGYSALTIAEKMPADGKAIACDVSEEWTGIARRYWASAGVASKIQLILGPALETLEQLNSDSTLQPFDMAFIDADKENIDAYYEYCLQLVRPGGLILIDNTLWEGKLIEPDADDPETEAFRQLNLKIRQDQRVEHCLVPIGDGLTMIWKKVSA